MFMGEERHLAFSSIANYLNRLVSLAAYMWDSDGFEFPEAVASANFTVTEARW